LYSSSFCRRLARFSSRWTLRSLIFSLRNLLLPPPPALLEVNPARSRQAVVELGVVHLVEAGAHVGPVGELEEGDAAADVGVAILVEAADGGGLVGGEVRHDGVLIGRVGEVTYEDDVLLPLCSLGGGLFFLAGGRSGLGRLSGGGLVFGLFRLLGLLFRLVGLAFNGGSLTVGLLVLLLLLLFRLVFFVRGGGLGLLALLLLLEVFRRGGGINVHSRGVGGVFC
ncbi:hypothetical protein CI238_11261, partial [Colletotrichum incanum]